jgi:heme exporter protein D
MWTALTAVSLVALVIATTLAARRRLREQRDDQGD